MQVSRPAPAPSIGLALALRRWTSFFSLFFAIGFFVSGLGSLVFLPQVLELLGFSHGVSLGMGALCSVFNLALAASLASSALKCLKHKGPALVVNGEGITDYFHLNAFIPWSDIESATLDYGDGNHLVLVLRAGAVSPKGDVVRKTWLRRTRRLFNGGDLSVPLHGVVYQHKRLNDALERYLQQARQLPRVSP